MGSYNFKTWIEIKKSSIEHNFGAIKSLLKPKTEFWAVVKSNAYGHGLVAFSKIAENLAVDGFCVDSVIEANKLREEYIRKPILVLGPTLPHLLASALQNDICITISNFEHLNNWIKSKYKPAFHLKIDTGMHRQGFFVEDVPSVIALLKNWALKNKTAAENYLKGIYSHFASAKDINYPTFSDLQFNKFLEAVKLLEKAGIKNFKKHITATGGTLTNPKYHLDLVRIGIGLYGFWPSKELEIQVSEKISLKPILSWHALISEIKNLKAGEYVGYDLTEKITKPTKIAILPIGYWHGFPRALSSIGEALVGGKKARVIGRVSMDLITVDVTGINCRVSDIATIIGKQKENKISAEELAQKTNTSHYEIITRINPLIERAIK